MAEAQQSTSAPTVHPSAPADFDYTKHITGAGTSEDPFAFTDPFSGNTYNFDNTLQQWIQVPEAVLIAKQQQIYGKNVANNDKVNTPAQSSADGNQEKSEATPTEQTKEKRKKKKKKKTNSVYVTNLPLDVTKKEVFDFFSKCGLIKKDPETADPKIALYEDDQKRPKGDALITYYRPESVDLAIKILDGSEFRPGKGGEIKVAKAEFKEKEGSAPKPKKPMSKKVKRYNQQKELSWDEDDNVHVILSHMFTQEEAWNDVNFFVELEQDIRTECEKYGEVHSIKIFERNADGVVAVKFRDHEAAAMCVEKLDGRYFAGQAIKAEFYDNFTNYAVEETEEQAQERLKKFHQFIEEGVDDEDEDS